MLQTNETFSPPEGPQTAAPAPEVVPASTKRPTRWPWIVGFAVVVVLAAAATTWSLGGSTVSQHRYDETVAELTASEEALAAARDEAAELQAQVDELGTEAIAQADRVAELEALSGELQERIMSARAVARFVAYRSLDYFAEEVVAMQQVGDTTSADALLRQLGETGEWIEWVDAGGWTNVGNSIAQIDDAVLSSAWSRWLDAEIGSVEEMTAWAELEQRIAYLLLDALADG